MREAVTRVQNAGVGAQTLEESTLLYEALLGYQYLGDCRNVLENLPVPAPAQRELVTSLERACDRFVIASETFTSAVQADDPALLRVASREALRGGAHLRVVEGALA